MEKIQLKIKLNNENAKLPSYGSDFAAGMDIYSSEDSIVPPLSTKLIKTGIAVSWSGKDAENHYLRIAPRSGLAYKNGIFVNAGVVDYDYRGEIGVVLYNSKNEDFKVNKGDRIAQMILERINRPNIIESNELDETVRGTGGFGSTGSS